MSFELDHVFVLASAGAPEGDQLVAFGLSEGSRNVHRGQGTANRRFFFARTMLELLYLTDEGEARSPVTAPTRLADRASFRNTGASPFGICIRRVAGQADAAVPFESFGYRPAYLPPGIEIATAATSAEEPLVFVAPGQFQRRTPEPTNHPCGLQEITGVRVAIPNDVAPSASLRVLERLGIASFVSGGPEHLMELSFDGAPRARSLDLRPALPLVLRY